MRKILFFVLCCLFVCSTKANILDDCLKKIENNGGATWQDLLFKKDDGVFSELGPNKKLTQEFVQSKKPQIYALIAGNVVAYCNADLAKIAKISRGKIFFTHNQKKYDFNFSTETLFEYIDMRTGFLVINKKGLKPGDVVQLSDIPRKSRFFSPECSDDDIWDNLDDDAAVNVAGQKVFTEFGGTDNEFFLDFAPGNDRRAFPGLVLEDVSGSTTEKIVSYLNIPKAIQKMEAFGNLLKNSACSNQGLALYLVALDIKYDTSAEKKGWLIGASIAGGAMAYLGISYALAMSTLSVSSVLITSGIAASSVPVVGWIVGGVLVAAAGIISVVPSEIEDIQQVMVLEGPINL